MPPIVLITRPEPDGKEFAATLRTQPGGDVAMIHSPILQIVARGTVPDVSPYRWLIFTSRNGVRHFSAASARRDIPSYGVGDATADEAKAVGIESISCSGDARDMLARIKADGVCGPMLHLRGEHAAADIAGALRTAGVEADEAVIYAQEALPLNDTARACLMGDAPVIAPIFSPRSAAALFDGITPSAPVIVLAISAAAAARVPEGVASAVVVADRPDTAGILRAWPAALDASNRLEGTKRAQ